MENKDNVKHGVQYIMLAKRLCEDPRVSADALAAIAFIIASQGYECQLNKDSIRKRFGWGHFTWYNVSRELKALGFVTECFPGGVGTKLMFKIWQPLDSSDFLDEFVESLSNE